MIRSIPFALAFAAALALAACSTDTETHDSSPNDALTSNGGARTVKYSFDATSGEWPAGTTFTFSDYPISEDAEARSSERIAAEERLAQRLRDKLGRPALLSEYLQYGAELDHEVNQLGYWLNARFEKAVATDATPAVVFSQSNRSDDVDTNILFTLDAASGLTKSTRYSATATMTLRTNAAVGCFGVGGSPDAVYYSLDFSKTPFTRGVDRNDHWRLTNRASADPIDPSAAVDPGELAGTTVQLGTIGAPHATDCAGWNEFEQITHSATGDFETDENGVLHGLLRSHSGFESTSVWALESFTVTLERR